MRHEDVVRLFSLYLMIVIARGNPTSTKLNSRSISNGDCGVPGCEQFPDPPPEEDEPELELFDLLSRGSEYLANYTDQNEAVVFLGNTGSGKSTLAQVVAGDLSKLHYGFTSKCIPTIVDEDGKIGRPTTKSKTLFPDLIINNGLAFYDYPGFDDTRGHVSDIAANFFMTQVTGKITNIKMLFLVIWGSVDFSDKLDFDLLATHAATFVNNLDNYTNSFGLVVTKVPNYIMGNIYFQDHSVINRTAEFLQTYKEEQLLNLVNSKMDDEITRKKIVFVETLLEKNPVTGNYSKIWFFRVPLECGSLNDHQMPHDTKNNVTKLIDELEYTRINITTDFAFTLKSESKLEIVNYTRSINTEITTAVTNVTQDLEEIYFQFENFIDLNNLNFTELFETTNSNGTAIASILSQLSNNVSNSNELSNVMISIWNLLSYHLSNKFQEFMMWQEEYLSFFDEAMGNRQDRLVDRWSTPLINFQNIFNNHFEWFKFSLSLESNSTSYLFQSVKNHIPPKSAGQNWLDYIESYGITTVTESVRNAAKNINEIYFILLEVIIDFALKETKSSCDSTLKTAIIEGNFVLLDQSSTIPSLIQTCGVETTQIFVFAGHTIFLGADIELENVDMAILAPLWINPANLKCTISLNGQDISKIRSINPQSSKAGVGQDGTPGCSGKPGGPGGSFFGVTDKVISSKAYEINSIGGTGGKGGNGGNGGIGDSTRNADHEIDRPDYDWETSGFCGGIVNFPWYFESHWGINGFKGGNGGNGGRGGVGGLAGNMEMTKFEAGGNVCLTKTQGNVGQNGTGGDGGAGGNAGLGYSCSMTCGRFWTCIATTPSYGRGPGAKGSSGLEGRSNSCFTAPEAPTEISKWSVINKYYSLFYNNTHPVTTNFIKKIGDNSKAIGTFTLKALAEESLALANINRTTGNPIRLKEMYVALTERMEEFFTANSEELSTEHKQILNMLLTSAYSSLMNLDRFRAYDVIVDVTSYFAIVKSQIESLRTANALIAIREAKEKFTENLKEKVEQALGFLEDIVNPAIEEAATDIENKLNILEEQLREMILDAELSLEESKEKLRKANSQQGIFKILKVFSIITSIASSLMPNPKLRTLDTVIKQLQTEFSGKADELEKLRQLVEEMERLVEDLNAKEEIFENEFQPVVDSLLNYFRSISESLGSDDQISAPQLGLTKWQVLTKLRDTKFALESFSDTSLNVAPLRHAFDQIHDAMTIAIDLYEMIDKYLETQSLAVYIANVNSAGDPMPITDPDFKHTVAEFDIKLKENLLEVEVKKAMHAFKQWVFPFAKFYFGGQNMETGDGHLNRVEKLHTDLEKYKTLSVGNQDTFIILTNFSSGLKTSKPFFTWENSNWRENIELLLSGSKVNFNADIMLQGLTGWEAIKFRQIEINFKLNNSPDGMQAEFDDLIDYFGVSMTHSGISYYRFLDNYFVMIGANQTLIYNFERDTNGNRLGTNRVYEKFKVGDFLLSPYTVWTLELFNAVPKQKDKNIRNDVSFVSLQKFLPYMDVELVGMGIYVNGEEALMAAGGNLLLDQYYERDGRVNRRMKSKI